MEKDTLNEFNNLKLIIESPRLYLANYFENMINDIDLFCIKYISLLEKGSVLIDEAFDRNAIMTKEIYIYQSRCLKELPLDNTILQDITRALELVGFSEKMSANAHLVYNMMYRVQMKLFVNGSMVFIDSEWIKDAHMSSFGKLLLVENEFIGPRDILNIKKLGKRYSSVNSNKYRDGQYNDYSLFGPDNSTITLGNEDLKALYLIQSIKDMKSHLPYEKISPQLVPESSCNLKHYAELTQLDTNLFHGFSNLTDVQISFNHRLKSLTTDKLFDGLHNLTSLRLSSNCLTELHWNIFNGLNNLNNLDLSKNCLKHLDSRLFVCLTNLKKIDLSHNQLKVIDSNLFKGLKNLLTVDLRHNNIKINGLKVFKGLEKLIIIDENDDIS